MPFAPKNETSLRDVLEKCASLCCMLPTTILSSGSSESNLWNLNTMHLSQPSSLKQHAMGFLKTHHNKPKPPCFTAPPPGGWGLGGKTPDSTATLSGVRPVSSRTSISAWEAGTSNGFHQESPGFLYQGQNEVRSENVFNSSLLSEFMQISVVGLCCFHLFSTSFTFPYRSSPSKQTPTTFATKQTPPGGAPRALRHRWHLRRRKR